MDRRSRRAPSAAVDDGTGRSRVGLQPSNRSVRSATSRFSLRDQWAATRQEYEFGFDDASSIVERFTEVSAVPQADNDVVAVGEGSVVFVPDPSPTPGSEAGYRDCYELLCLPRGAALSPEQVHAAARRLIQVLAVDKQSSRLRASAAFYLGLTQAAFETLVEPSRRLGYDLSGAGDADDSDIDEVDLEEAGIVEGRTYESKLQDQYALFTQRESRATTDVGLRVAPASLLTSQQASQGQGSGLGIVDFSLRKSTTAPVPALRVPFEKAVAFFRNLAKQRGLRLDALQAAQLSDPTLTVTGATHGLLDEPFKIAPLLLDRYQPPGPSLHGARRMEQLLASRFLPVLDFNLRQEIFWRKEARSRALPDLIIEQEVGLLPQPSTTTRIGHSIVRKGNAEPVHVEVLAQKFLGPRGGVAPSLGLAVHQKVRHGSMFLLADAGDWNLRTPRECREISKFSQLSGAVSPMLDVFRNPPTLEVGYAFGGRDLGMQSGQALTKPFERRGLARLGHDLDENKPASWTVSTGLTPGNSATYLRYGRDFFTTIPGKTTTPTPTNGSTPLARATHDPKTAGFRAEVELSTTSTRRDFFLSLRALKYLTRSTKAGLELGLSPSNLHLSLHLSRLGTRFSLPLLITPQPLRSLKLLFVTTVLPFTLLAAWELRRALQRVAAVASATKSVPAIERRERHRRESIARRRAEADELTAVLATGVEPRQAAQKKRGGLVIQSAKYGVRGAPPEEVADVTIAVAALVDGEGRLVIPEGVRKGRLLGFWDPAPGVEAGRKVLRVGYLWRGEERVVEVVGRGEVRLP
ncbi:hypothetical protein C8A05DRAFT_18119 [Staphylotrichum tortipilum]|uniref:J domain-containing protein n=1 Tax=Staphylotrichum tortipilum TaxID=2831512 RepID=A0AAN6RQ98_9PEZI|nr:hypothetical protein C8A05DRAFT_18119 [Staphylotrichum longicolle]